MPAYNFGAYGRGGQLIDFHATVNSKALRPLWKAVAWQFQTQGYVTNVQECALFFDWSLLKEIMAAGGGSAPADGADPLRLGRASSKEADFLSLLGLLHHPQFYQVPRM